MTAGGRIAWAMRRKNMRQDDLAAALGVSQNIVSRIINGKMPGNKHIGKIAVMLDVPPEWLTVGDNPPSWAAHGYPARAAISSGQGLEVEGQVSAGPGDIDQWADIGGRLRFGERWAAVRVKGDSAYPVVYPDQYALIDYARAVTPDRLDEAAGWDLDDDVVLVWASSSTVRAGDS